MWIAHNPFYLLKIGKSNRLELDLGFVTHLDSDSSSNCIGNFLRNSRPVIKKSRRCEHTNRG